MSDVYDGPAAVRIGEEARTVRVRLAGHFDPIDGRYHWQGTVFDELSGHVRLPQQIILTIDDQEAQARIVERPAQGGGYSVAGVGVPPFALAAVEVR